jgi:hypothetical protein
LIDRCDTPSALIGLGMRTQGQCAQCNATYLHHQVRACA